MPSIIKLLRRALDSVDPDWINEDGKVDEQAWCELPVSVVLDAIAEIERLSGRKSLSGNE